MNALSSTALRRLHTQGFGSVDPSWLGEVAPWLRFSPALCATITALGTLMASPPILFALAAVAVLGAALPFHPFDLIYNFGIRFLVHKPALPSNGAPRRFACGVASIWLVATALSFAYGAPFVGYALGALFVAVAGLVSTTDICIPSIVFGYITRRRQPG